MLNLFPASASANWGNRIEPLKEAEDALEIQRADMTPLEFFDYVGNNVKSLVETIDSIGAWFRNYKENLAEISVNLMQVSFDFLTKLTLQTPIFLFDNEWFKDNLLSFAGLSIVGIIVISLWEGFKRMTKNILPTKKPIEFTDMNRIYKRLPLVLAGSLLAPTLFVYGFQGINLLTQLILDIGKYKLGAGISEFDFSATTLLETVGYVGFTVALVYFLIPIMLSNFSRWFTIIALGIISPLAMASWIFKSTEHFFTKFWTSLKKNSITQIVYGLFLLIISSVMFASKPPEDHFELLVKMGVIIGGFNVMATAQNYIGSYIAKTGDISTMWENASVALKPNKDVKKVVDTGDKAGGYLYEKVIPKGVKNKVEKLFGKKDLY